MLAGGPVENAGALVGGVMHQVKTTFEGAFLAPLP